MKCPAGYQKAISEQIETKPEARKNANSLGTASGTKKFTSKYYKYSFNRIAVNSWKNKFKNTADKDVVFKKAGILKFLDDDFL